MPREWHNGPIRGQPGVGGPGGWNNGPIGGQPGAGGPGGWKYGPLGGPPGLPTPVPSGGWNNGPTNTNQDLAKKADSEKLTVDTSGSSSPHEVHFALSLVPLLRAQPLPARLQKEADILRAFAPVDTPGFYRPFESSGLDW
ncbi:uncharacterized protein LOC134790157 [Cydia splendana]|uniref:uncharacterized protein LOC134790157 n=1 Tax=Cydia splendana TaxID=1100963 RepID=UPI0028F48425